jgi:DNA-binding NtrC family response regulator
VHHFILKKSREMKRLVVPSPSPNAIDRMMAYHWPGNIRELENAVERSLILNQDGILRFIEIGNRVKHTTPLPCFPVNPAPPEQNISQALDAVMSQHIRRVLAQCKGRVEGEKGAAKVLNIHPSTLRKRMKKLGVAFGRKCVV